MILYQTKHGLMLEQDSSYFELEESSLDELLALDDLAGFLNTVAASNNAVTSDAIEDLVAPIESQEVWASGVTYNRSRSARMEESKDAGGGDFYDRVYTAERPELFFKAVAHKVAGPNSEVCIRNDAKWSVPEPELALVINPRGEIVGYTIGNDMSSRDIEGTNPLYLPQAKVYDRSCALGPGILVRSEPMPAETRIALEIWREGVIAFAAEILWSEMRRDPKSLVEYLYRDQSFPYGSFLLTGTGIVPPDDFTLAHGDEIHISIDGIGTLVNTVA